MSSIPPKDAFSIGGARRLPSLPTLCMQAHLQRDTLFLRCSTPRDKRGELSNRQGRFVCGQKGCLGLSALLCGLAWLALAQQPVRGPASQIPKSVSLIFRETFKGRAPGAPQQVPLTPQGLTNANLELKLYGPGAPPSPDHESGLALNNEE